VVTDPYILTSIFGRHHIHCLEQGAKMKEKKERNTNEKVELH